MDDSAMGTRPGAGIMLSTGGVTGPLTGAGLRGGMPVVIFRAFLRLSFGVVIGALAGTVNGTAADIGVLAEVDSNMWSIVMPVFGFATLLASSGESLLFCRTAFRCWPITAILGWRASQAWMPSCHVC